MKRYISAVLIPCLLLQLCGCYSWRIVETPEPGSHIKITTNDNEEIEFKKWFYEDGNIIGDMGYTFVKVEKTINQKEINKIEEEYLNEGVTAVMLGSFLIVVFSTIIIIKNSMFR